MYTRRALEGKALLEAELGLRRQVHGQRHRGHERPREGDLREDRERLVEEGGRRGDAVGEALLLDLPLRRRAVGAEERRDAEARRSVEVEVELELGPRLGLERRGDVGAVPVEGRVDVEAQALDALGPRLPGGPGREKGAKFPTSKAPLSAVFRSFRLIFGRAIISRNGLEAWMLFPERARAEENHVEATWNHPVPALTTARARRTSPARSRASVRAAWASAPWSRR